MKVAHWSLSNGSGLNSVADELSAAEEKLGINSLFIPTDKLKDSVLDKTGWGCGMDADIHVVHSHLPDEVRDKKGKIVYVAHGTPEVCFQSASEGITSGSWGLSMYWLKMSDAIVTFWPRHKYILQSFSDKGRVIDLIEQGVTKEFWKPVKSRGKYAGKPSFLICENSHKIKWCYDIAIAWPEISKQIRAARLHISYLPVNQFQVFYSMFYRNGLMFSSYVTGARMGKVDLRNALVSTDYYLSPVMYGDHNAMCLEAKACGNKIISYAGNPYADYWLSSQDQRTIAKELIAISKGKVKPRKVKKVPDISETAKAMLKIYERIN